MEPKRTCLATIEPEGGSWQAEDEHLDCLLKYPNGYACHFPRSTMPAS